MQPTHSHLNLSPGLDFATQIIAKRNLVEVLRKALAQRSYLPGLLNIGSATDRYQPAGRELRPTRGLIELMGEVRHPCSLVTKSGGVERDLELIAPMAAQKLAAVHGTVSTLDAGLERKPEPRAAAPYRRLRTIERLAQAGVPVGASVAPQIRFVNNDREKVLEAAGQAGARSAFSRYCDCRERSHRFLKSGGRCITRNAGAHHGAHPRHAGGKDYDGDFARARPGMTLKPMLTRSAAAHGGADGQP